MRADGARVGVEYDGEPRGRKAAGSQPAAHCRFYQGPLTVTGRDLPSQPALFRDHRQMAISLCW
jgi:hypothetical protein